MAHKLRSLTIAGYKSIREQKVELRDINVLIGANGSGKSNFVAAFHLLHDVVERNLSGHVARQGGADRLLYFGRKVTSELRFELDFSPNSYQLVLEPTVNDALYVRDERARFHGEGHPQPYEKHVTRGEPESLLREVASNGDRVATHVLESIQSWRRFHFHDASDAAPPKQKQQLNDSALLRGDAKNLAAFLYRIREQGKGVALGGPHAQLAMPFYASYRKIVAAVQRVAPYFEDFVLEPDPIRPDLIQLAWRQKGSDDYFGPHSLSDGTLRFICLATLLLQPEQLLPSTILIDEPELGLHPFAIHSLAGLIRSVSTRSQVILATQSVTLLNQFNPADVIVVDRAEDSSVFRRLSPEDVATWVDDYSLGELWEKNVIGGRPA